MGSLNDPIADLLTRIRNANMAKHRFVDVPHSKMKEAIVKVLKEKGFVAHYLVKEENRKGLMRVFLKYVGERKCIINGLKRSSTPSLRKYVSSKKIPRVLGGIGIAIISTSQGVVSGDAAREQKLGGELLCFIW